ncbi:MAG: alanine dehydrogenase [Saprospiraceae bacterium]|nr:alanine dehydrogenase [Saprospiraceae bacterium]
MSETTKKIPIPKSLTEGQLQPQPEMLAVKQGGGRMTIGIPKAAIMQETRVALVPSAVTALTDIGFNVLMETGAGEKANYTDHRYSECGAEICFDRDKVFQSNVLLMVAPPTLEEIALFHPNQFIISPLHIPTLTEDFVRKMLEKRVISMAMEYIKDENGSFPLVRVMSELAGISVVLTAAELMASTGGGKGVLLGGIAGVPSAKVVVLGAGIVGESATRVALGLGADIRVFDNDVYKLMRLQRHVGQKLNTSTLNPSQLEKELINADVVIGAVHSKTGRSPVIVPERIVEKMKPGSVVIDVSIDQGGCFETSEITSLDRPTFVKHGVVHYCVPKIASKVPRPASIAISNILTPMLINASKSGGLDELLFEHFGLRNGVYTYKGRLTNAYMGRRFGIKHTDLGLLMASRS